MISILPGPREAADALARLVVEQARAAIAARGRFRVALSGGSTPEALYRRLAEPDLAGRIEWPVAEVFWSDERCVPPTDPASNYRMAEAALLGKVPITAAMIHRIEGELPPAESARRYQRRLLEVFGGPPRFDLVLLGVGEDGHVASLFPGAPSLRETERLAVAVRGPTPPPDRVTLTLPVINGARAVALLVTGSGKAAIVARILGPARTPTLPASQVAPVDGRPSWFLDRAAAAALPVGRTEPDPETG